MPLSKVTLSRPIPRHFWAEMRRGYFCREISGRTRGVSSVTQCADCVLALYGHPLSGAYWEKHCTDKFLKLGFEKIPDWESCYLHRKLRLVLLVYVDDFKMAGDKNSLKAGWALIRKEIRMDDPTPTGKFCDAATPPRGCR